MIAFPGLIGRKLGMTQVFREDGSLTGVTFIEAGPYIVTQVKTEERDGYNAIQLGFSEAKRINSPQRGHLKGLPPVKHLKEFRTPQPPSLQRGDKVDVSLFKAGDKVNITGISKGKGFAGVVKRYHFAGGPKTHGQSDKHRAPGAIGSTTFPGRVYKGKKMAGHMGCEQVTVRNLEVVQTEPERNLLMVKGAVPGSRDSLVYIHKSKVW